MILKTKPLVLFVAAVLGVSAFAFGEAATVKATTVSKDTAVTKDATPDKAAAKSADKSETKNILDFDASARSATDRRYTQSYMGLAHLLYDKQDMWDKTGLFIIGRHTQVGQMNMTSERGMFTHRHAGRWQGVYDIDAHWNLGPLLDMPNTAVHMTVSGRWSNGLNATSVGAFTNVSAFGSYEGNGDEVVYISQLFVDQKLFDDALLVRAGKMSLGNFDRNFFAEDASRQFMNVSLVGNPTIPYPENGLGVMANLRIHPNFYVMGAVVDSHAQQYSTGFDTTFHGPDDFFYIGEAGFENLVIGNKPLPTAIRAGMWFDPQSKGTWDNGAFQRNTKNDDAGFYLNFAQMLWKENPDTAADKDMQGLGMFGRYGYRATSVNWFNHYWSVGCQYQGLIPGRDKDTLGFGVAQVLLDDDTGTQTASETAYEIYYDITITPFFNVGASTQYIKNPGGIANVDEALVMSFRVSLTF